MSDIQNSSSSEIVIVEPNTISQSESDKVIELAIYAQHDAKKRNALSQKLSMLQKEERALQTLLIRLRNQQSALTIEKIRLSEAHKKIAGDDQLSYLNDDEEDEDESSCEEINEDNYEINEDPINNFLENEITEFNKLKTENN